MKKVTAVIAGVFFKCNKWQDFRDCLRLLTKKQKGDYFEVFTQFFLELHPNYATKLKKVWRIRNVPLGVRTLLNLPDSDEGIDLVAETKEGEYWAIQCKYREDQTKSLTRKELSTFTDLALNICHNISLALVCTTSDRFSHKLKLYGERLSFCAGDVWRNLDEDFFRRLHSVLKGKLALPDPAIPRPHQSSAIQNARDHFVVEKETRGKLIMPCGTGKSLTAYWIANNLGARKVLIAVPSLALIRQTLEVWARESIAHNRNINWICVCSDQSVTKIDRDDISVFIQDLGVRVYTDPDQIARWFKT